MNRNYYVVIMAGGIGSRFWPKSRNNFPKQFIDVLGIGKSLLYLTYERFLKICPPENIYIVSNSQYKEIIQDQIPQLTESQILLEPSRNNTAPCIAYASYKISKINPLATIVVAPSDHLILKEDIFQSKVEQALRCAAGNDVLITLGITPTRPDTGYGYIKFEGQNHNGIHKVYSFMEKPVLRDAEKFVKDGGYLWNAGIFIWSANSIKNAFEKYVPEISSLFDLGDLLYNTENESSFIEKNYSKSPNVSIDYAILEKADNVYTIPSDIGWSDLGTWTSLFGVSSKDTNNNTSNCESLNLQSTANCIINLPPGKAAVIKGLNDYIIVDDGKVLLIYPKSDEQEIKNVASKMAQDFGDEYL